ncbi:phosphatase PAP2 family protein [Companilactobacillus halodurans]|uniref:Phosphatase PAP2 family protein n=1 Tax=Companilactobacillus halodurans TaxID=2584183 RepID=A0A5P0ZXX7_9LACO|nr:phosphatase PAP2 family protein [Companilactobacillus halodurans]MQS75704.1 phosphatase PAP2 family protein [Companilactobacillus halodurans]MQS97648.1 phosphatase PAP2 family protein [Companilactobacillus halodurans]
MIFKQNKNRKWLTLIYLTAFFLLELMVITNNSFLMSFDHSIQNLFGDITTPFNTELFSTITFLGSPIMDVIYLIVIILFLFKQDKKIASLWIGFLLISGNIISFLVKISVKRERPLQKIIPASGYSFPSGHTFGTTILVLTIIVFILPQIKNQSLKTTLNLVMILWLIVVSISRIYLRGHFPSDVIGSILLASTWWEFSELLYLRYSESIYDFLKLKSNDE